MSYAHVGADGKKQKTTDQTIKRPIFFPSLDSYNFPEAIIILFDRFKDLMILMPHIYFCWQCV